MEVLEVEYETNEKHGPMYKTNDSTYLEKVNEHKILFKSGIYPLLVK